MDRPTRRNDHTRAVQANDKRLPSCRSFVCEHYAHKSIRPKLRLHLLESCLHSALIVAGHLPPARVIVPQMADKFLTFRCQGCTKKFRIILSNSPLQPDIEEVA